MKKLLAYISLLPRSAVITIGLVLVLALGVLDYLTGYEWAFSIFYLLPVFLVTWYAGLKWGVVTSALSGLTLLAADLVSGHQYSHPAISYWNMLVMSATFLVIAYTIAQLNKVLAAERTFARTDALTGVSNARHFEELAKNITKQNAGGKKQCALAYIDLDNFKAINDDYGHSTGDQLLKMAAGIIKANLREEDVVARLGGDEFGVIISAASQREAEEVFERIRANFLHEMKKRKWQVTFSGGVVYFENCTASVDEMIGMADRLMYTVKKNGKNSIQYHCQK
jgi:diguanylate cyclase (GGDEF)-like protein